MQGFQRSQVDTLLRRLDEQPHRIIALFGPRQTGKTKLVRQALRRTARLPIYRSLDEMDAAESGPLDTEPMLPLPQRPNVEWLVRVWQHARQETEKHPHGVVLAFDEIHALPQWATTIKGLWDADRANNRNMHVIILGSAPLHIQSGLNESLAGRFEPISVGHWSFSEMADAFNFDLAEYIYFGGYPGSAHLIREEERWRSYVLDALIKPNIEKDILAMTKVEKPALLRRLFRAWRGLLRTDPVVQQDARAASGCGQRHNPRPVSRSSLHCGPPSRPAQIFDVAPSSASFASPKLNVLNTALATADSGYTFADGASRPLVLGPPRRKRGRRTHPQCRQRQRVRAYYWRKGHLEVDFVLRRGPRTIAIEVKSGPQRLRSPGMGAFARQFSPHRTMLVGDGGIPLADFLTSSLDRWFDGP